MANGVTVQPPEPYIPFAPLQGSMRALYHSLVQVTRAQMTMTDQGTASVSWGPISAMCDSFLVSPGYMMCRLDLQFIRRGVDQPAPVIAGRAPDRMGVVYYDPVADPVTGIPAVLAGDRLVCVSGPVMGVFEIRTVPDVAQDFIGAHHIEVQVVETSQALQPGSVQPFPGSAP
jgi:hypothetical protein